MIIIMTTNRHVFLSALLAVAHSLLSLCVKFDLRRSEVGLKLKSEIEIEEVQAFDESHRPNMLFGKNKKKKNLFMWYDNNVAVALMKKSSFRFSLTPVCVRSFISSHFQLEHNNQLESLTWNVVNRVFETIKSHWKRDHQI